MTFCPECGKKLTSEDALVYRIHWAMRSAGHAMRVAEISKAIGRDSASVNATLHNYIRRRQRFVKLKRGLYGLKEWLTGA